MKAALFTVALEYLRHFSRTVCNGMHALSQNRVARFPEQFSKKIKKSKGKNKEKQRPFIKVWLIYSYNVAALF